jgi:hypothetical protein
MSAKIYSSRLTKLKYTFTSNNKMGIVTKCCHLVTASLLNSMMVACSHMMVGCTVGCTAGCMVGCTEGCTAGCKAGCMVGCKAGCTAGCMVGCKVGCMAGCMVGCTVGCMAVGCSHSLA